MTKNTEDIQRFVRMKIVGVGGAGGNTLSRIKSSRLHGIDLVAINTDAQDLRAARADVKMRIGKNVTRGLGAGMDPQLGARSAEEDLEEIKNALKGLDMVVLTAGLGGGTGSGAMPVIAAAAKEMGVLTLAVFTKPFAFEGPQRRAIAEEAAQKVQERVDAYLVIENDRIASIVDRETSIDDAFMKIDEILRLVITGFAEIIVYPGLINVDFADVKVVLKDAGPIAVGFGEGFGPEKAKAACEEAMRFPVFLEHFTSAKRIIYNIVGGEKLSFMEIQEIGETFKAKADSHEAKIIFGLRIDKTVKKDSVRVMYLASGFNGSLKNHELFIDEAAAPAPDQLETPAFLRRKKQA